MNGSFGLRLRRMCYSLRPRLGLSGYRIGSWHHLLQCLVRLAPLPHLMLRTKMIGCGFVWLACLVLLAMTGANNVVLWALLMTVALWLLFGTVLFFVDLKRRPRPGNPPSAGVREPRSPSPNSGAESQRERLGDSSGP